MLSSDQACGMFLCFCKQAFDKFDADGSGLLDADEFAQAMHVLGLRLSKEEYKLLFDEYDADGSGEIDLVSAAHQTPTSAFCGSDMFQKVQRS